MKTLLRLMLVLCVLGLPAMGCKKEQGSTNPNVTLDTSVEHGKSVPSSTNDGGPSDGGGEHSK